jgi:hypothetical protein
LSVLTDRKFFQGSFEYLQDIRNAGVTCPLLCKEFIVEVALCLAFSDCTSKLMLLKQHHFHKCHLADTGICHRRMTQACVTGRDDSQHRE